MSFPESLAFICASHVSCVARVDVVSPSLMLRIASRNDGMEPVVIAFKRGIVTVGDRAKAVKGIAAPSRMSLAAQSEWWPPIHIRTEHTLV